VLKLEINQKEEDIQTIAFDSTRIKVINRGEWIRDKMKEKRGFIKIHAVVNVKTKQIVSMEVTKEVVANAKMLKLLVDYVTSSVSFPYAPENRIEIKADGAYDSNYNFGYLSELKIIPVIKVRNNSSINTK
jgi:hypothetical protein